MKSLEDIPLAVSADNAIDRKYTAVRHSYTMTEQAGAMLQLRNNTIRLAVNAKLF